MDMSSFEQNYQHFSKREDISSAFSVKITMMMTRTPLMDIIESGSFLYDVLLEEPELKIERSKATMESVNFDEMERTLKEEITLMHNQIGIIEKEVSQAQADERSIQSILKKRKTELERSEERLATFMNVRPPYMDEYEVLQEQLQGLFSTYSDRFRNLQWLEFQLESFHRSERQKQDEVQNRMQCLQQRFREEEMKFLQGADMVHLSLDGKHGVDIEEYESKDFNGDSHYPMSLRTDNLLQLGKSEPDVLDDGSTDTPSVEQDIEDDDSDNNF